MKNLLLIILLSFLSIFVNLYEWKTTNNSIKALSVNADAKRKVIDIHNVNNRRISQRKEGIPTQTGHKTNTISTPLLIESNNNKSTKIDTSKINDNVF